MAARLVDMSSKKQESKMQSLNANTLMLVGILHDWFWASRLWTSAGMEDGGNTEEQNRF